MTDSDNSGKKYERTVTTHVGKAMSRAGKKPELRDHIPRLALDVGSLKPWEWRIEVEVFTSYQRRFLSKSREYAKKIRGTLAVISAIFTLMSLYFIQVSRTALFFALGAILLAILSSIKLVIVVRGEAKAGASASGDLTVE